MEHQAEVKRFIPVAILAGRLAAVRSNATNDMRFRSLLRRLNAQERAQVREAVATWQREAWALLSPAEQEREVGRLERALGG